MRERLNAALFEARRSSIREFSALAKSVPGCIALTLGEPEFDTPVPIRDAAHAALEAGETHYIANNGAAELRERIAAFERERNGMDYGADEIIVTAGATEALFVALFGVLEPGDEVIIPTPAFVLYQEIVKLCRGVPVFLDTSSAGFQIDPAALAEKVTPRTKAIVLNTPNNPTGVVYNAASLEAVRAAAEARALFVICDDVYRQLVYSGDYHSFAEYRGLRDRLLVVQSFSKPYAMTGWRMGYLMADAVLKERLELLHQFLVVSTPAPFQRAAAAALDVDPSPLRETYRRRRDYALGRLRAMGLPTITPEGAFYAFPSIESTGLGSETFCRRMTVEAGVAVTPGACFGGEGHVRLTFCCPDDDLRRGLDRMEGFLSVLKEEQG